MADRKPTALYFTTVAVLEKDLAILGGLLYAEETEPTITRSMICRNGGKWGRLKDMDDVVSAMTKKPVASPGARATLCMLGRRGHYREIASGTPPVDVRIDTKRSGYLLDLRFIGSHLYACGTQNQVHRQVGQQWVSVDQGTFSPLADQVDRAFESIDGTSENDIYAVGKAGAIWHWDGKQWSQLDSPTNFPLFCVLCSSNGNVYVGGSNGHVFMGGHDRGWADLSDPGVTKKVLWDMCEFEGTIYIAAGNKLVSSAGGPIQEVDVPVEGEKAFYAIDSGSGSLWTVGDECVLQFDGQTWQRHISPENQ